MQVKDLYLIINVISLIIIIIGLYKKRIYLFERADTVLEVLLSFVFVINIISVVILSVITLIINWNNYIL